MYVFPPPPLPPPSPPPPPSLPPSLPPIIMQIWGWCKVMNFIFATLVHSDKLGMALVTLSKLSTVSYLTCIHVHVQLYISCICMYSTCRDCVFLTPPPFSRYRWGGWTGVEEQRGCASWRHHQLPSGLCLEVHILWSDAKCHEDVRCGGESCLHLPLPQAAGPRDRRPD